jgi:hypothetical protein
MMRAAWVRSTSSGVGSASMLIVGMATPQGASPVRIPQEPCHRTAAGQAHAARDSNRAGHPAGGRKVCVGMAGALHRGAELLSWTVNQYVTYVLY